MVKRKSEEEEMKIKGNDGLWESEKAKQRGKGDRKTAKWRARKTERAIE